MAKHRHGRSLSRTKHATPPASRRYVASPVLTATASTRSAELRAGFEAFERGDYTQAIHAWKRAESFESRIVFGLADEEASTRLLGNDAAETLLGAGHLFARLGRRKEVEVLGLHLRAWPGRSVATA